MKLDPNVLCARFEESLPWALVHDAIAHPLLALTLYSAPAVRFHDWTSAKAWKRAKPAPVPAERNRPDILFAPRNAGQTSPRPQTRSAC